MKKKWTGLLVALTLAVGLTAGGAVASQASRTESSQTPTLAQGAWCRGPHWCWY